MVADQAGAVPTWYLVLAVCNWDVGSGFSRVGLLKMAELLSKAFFFSIKIKEIWHGLCEQILNQCRLPFRAGEGALSLLAKLSPEIPVEEGSSRFTACTTSSEFSAITESKWVNWGKCYLWSSQEFGTSPSPVQLRGLCFLSLLGKYILCRALGFCRLLFCDIAANHSHLLGSGG